MDDLVCLGGGVEFRGGNYTEEVNYTRKSQVLFVLSVIFIPIIFTPSRKLHAILKLLVRFRDKQ